jgi:hypothetical protein
MNWVKLVNVGTGFEADLLVERLKSAGIMAAARGNDIVGIFGPGFQGFTAHGVDVIVASNQLGDARELLSELDTDPADDAGDRDEESDE